jgi:hypothetical protein
MHRASIRLHINDLGGMDRPLQTEITAMTDKRTQEHADESNMIKDPESWTTGDEPMTGAQRSYLHTLAEEAGVKVNDDLTKAEASKKIDELQERTGRGVDHRDQRD